MIPPSTFLSLPFPFILSLSIVLSPSLTLEGGSQKMGLLDSFMLETVSVPLAMGGDKQTESGLHGYSFFALQCFKA